MNKYECEPCGYIYDPAIGDPESGIAPGTAFEDIPDDWWRTTGNWNDTGDNITGSDLRTFRGLPASMQSAVQRGAAAGVAGIQVRLDGRAVGEMVAPYVSTIIARDIV